MKKRLFSFFCLVLMLMPLVLTSCGDGAADTTTTGGEDLYVKPCTLNFYIVTDSMTNEARTAQTLMQEEFNKYARDAYKTQVQFIFCTAEDYLNRITGALENAGSIEGSSASQKFETSEVKTAVDDRGDTYELYEVVNNEPDETPILKSITNIIRYYGSVLYYVKLDKYVCAYDMATGMNQILLKVDKAEDLKVFIDGLVYASADGKAIYIRKRLELIVEKPGCTEKFFGKKPTVIQRRNNYEIYELNLVKCTCERIVDRVVDIIDQGGEYLFYTVAEELAPGQVETEETKKELAKLAVMAINTTTHEKQLVLEENCHIQRICGNKIIYTLNSPNECNLDLHIFDIPTMSDTLIEKNVYKFLAESDGRIFYYVGNKSYAPLFSNNFEGTDRVEVMTNIERVVKVLAGWMYVVKGSSRNALLMKISTDGKQRFVICSQFQKAVKVTDTYIYYVTTGNDLRVVRTDGKENTLIAENIDLNNVQIDQNRIYYIRREWIGKANGASLYVMDIEGHNVRKLLFDVRSMKNYDDNTLYVERDDKIRFHIVFPAPRKKDEKEFDETFALTRYYKFDKNTYEMDNILTVGMPHPSKYQLKGCILGKKKDLESIFTEIPIEEEFEEQGERAGSALTAQMAEKEAEQAKPQINSTNKGCGCGSFGGKK